MRPLSGYRRQGEEAYGTGTDLPACPHRAGTLAAIDWTIGWLEAGVRDPLMDADLTEVLDGRRDKLDQALTDRDRLLRETSAALPTAAACARAIARSLARWPGHCFAVARAIHESELLAHLDAGHGAPQALYGIYHGPIANDSMFKAPFANHGWIEYPSGLVVDPTRWVFTCTKPALAAVSIDDYDLAGRGLRRRLDGERSDPPGFVGGRVFTLPRSDPGTSAVAALLQASARWDGKVDLAQMFWIANLPIDRIGPQVTDVYALLDRLGLKSLIPIDNRNFVENASSTNSEMPRPGA